MVSPFRHMEQHVNVNVLQILQRSISRRIESVLNTSVASLSIDCSIACRSRGNNNKMCFYKFYDHK